MLTIADFKLGRILFPTIEDSFKESVGDSLEVVGAGLAAGERRPRPLDLTIPVRASGGELNPYVDGDRMRRQVRSLLENPVARLSGLYMKVSFDPELNGWTLIGGGSLEYAEGGVTFADYKLSLSDSYIVARRRTHRPARRVVAYDRRLSTTPRDIERLIYSTSFAGGVAVVKVALPHGATDARARNTSSAAIVQSLVTSDGGSSQLISNLLHGDVVSFEQPESAEGPGDVVIYDRRGNKAPAEMMTVKEPQATFGWEEVYGADYPLSANDVPVISNGLCRVRYLTVSGFPCFVLDKFVGGEWKEQSRVTPAVSELELEELVYCSVKEWTPERAVIFCRFYRSNRALDVYVTLQRGWQGPRFEGYIRPGEEQSPRFFYVTNDANEMAVVNAAGSVISTEAWSSNIAWAEATPPWGVLLPLAGGGTNHRFAIGNTSGGTCLRVYTDTFRYGATRRALQFIGNNSNAQSNGWVGVQFDLGGVETSKVLEAETYRFASGTTSEVSEGAASGGKAVQETQAAETNNTFREPTATTIGLVAGSSYALYVRVRVGTAGATASFRAIVGAEGTAIKTTTSLTYVWVYLGILKKPGSNLIVVNLWRSAGTGNTFIDRVIAVPAEVLTDDGAADFGQASLYDAQGVAELVSR